MNVFEVGVVVQLVDKVTAAMGVVTRSLMAGQAEANALNVKLKSITGLFQGGLLMMGGGVALAAPLVAATNEAAKLEMALKRVQVATQSSTDDMKGFKGLLADVANRTAVFSMPDLANFSAEMAASGIRTASDIKSLLPMFAEAADVLKVTAHIGPEQTAHVLSAMAHQFGRYKPEEMRPIIEAVTALAPRLPGGVKGFAGMGGYVNILGSRLLGIDPKELLTLQATAMQTTGGSGTGARGSLSGAMIMNTLMRALPGVFGSGLLEGKSAFALRSMGLTDAHGASTVMENGKMKLDKFLDKLAGFQDRSQTAEGRVGIAKEMMKYSYMLNKKQPDMDEFLKGVIGSGGKSIAPAELSMKLFAYAFGAGSRVAAAMSDPKFRQQHAFLQKEVNRAPSVEERQKQLMETLIMQQTRLCTNIKSLLAVIGEQALPILTNVTRGAGDLVDAMRKFLSAHPSVTRAIVGLTAAASAFLIIGGAGMVLKAAFLGIAFVASPLATAITAAASACGMWIPILLVSTPLILGVVAGITAIVAVVMNWNKIMSWARAHITEVKVAFAALLIACPPLGLAIKAITTVMRNWNSIAQVVTNTLGALGNALVGLANNAIKAINGIMGTNIGLMKSGAVAAADQVLKAYGADTLIKGLQSNGANAAKNVGKANAHSTNIDASVNIQNLHIQQQPGESIDHLMKRVEDSLNRTAQQNARSVTAGKGTHNSKFLHGGGHE